jgi:hypothetical protein
MSYPTKTVYIRGRREYGFFPVAPPHYIAFLHPQEAIRNAFSGIGKLGLLIIIMIENSCCSHQS